MTVYRYKHHQPPTTQPESVASGKVYISLTNRTALQRDVAIRLAGKFDHLTVDQLHDLRKRFC